MHALFIIFVARSTPISLDIHFYFVKILCLLLILVFLLWVFDPMTIVYMLDLRGLSYFEGIAQTMASAARAIGPTLGGFLYAWSQSNGIFFLIRTIRL